MIVAGISTLVVYAVMLRVLARGIITDALSILPVPDRYAARTARLLGLAPAAPA
jgi:hypothetical protein